MAHRSSKRTSTSTRLLRRRGRRTPVGELPAGATCDASARNDGTSLDHLRLTCGSGLRVSVYADAGALQIRGDYDFPRERSPFWDNLPLLPGTTVEFEATLDDPAPPPSCAGRSEQSVDLVLEHAGQRYERPYTLEDVHLRASFGPLEMHVETPWCQRTCVGKGDATRQHYRYVCTCWREPYETSMEVHVRDGIVYAIEGDAMPDTGRRDVKGVWSVPCGARLRYPAGTPIVSVEDGEYFDLTPEEERARAEGEAALDRELELK